MAVPGWLPVVIQVPTVLAGTIVVFRRRIPAAVGAILLAGVLGVVSWEAFSRGSYHIDARTFWGAGRAVWEGRDPYGDPRLLNPPSALPVFATFALLPADTFFAVWSVLILIGHALLAPASQVAVLTSESATDWKLGPQELLIFAAALLASVSTRTALAVGQIPLIPASGILLALAARRRGHPIMAGLGLALAAVKTTTMIPFLVLFLRRRDAATWVALAAAGLVMTLSTTRPTDLHGRISACLSNIRSESAPGATNDFSMANPLSADLIGLDHLFYHFGVRNRSVVKGAQWVGSVLLLAGTAWFLIRHPALPLAASASIAACACPLFSYHRQYDLVILALPLVYTTGRAGKEVGRARWTYRLIALATLAILYHRTSMLGSLFETVRRGGITGHLVEIFILPMSTWLILASLAMLMGVEHVRGSAPPASPIPPHSPSSDEFPTGPTPMPGGNTQGARAP